MLILDGNEAVVLVELASNGDAQVIVPETGRGLAPMAAEQLAQRYSGYIILIKPEYQFESTDAGSAKTSGKNWFWSAVTPLWPNYLQVLIAAALINILALASPLFIMNVYDRVLPNKAIATLWVLAIGIGIAISFDFILKILRSSMIGNAGRRADVLLASRLFAHVLNLDLSQRPMKTGEFANQLRDFENVREFFTSNTVVTLTDFIFIWLFIFIIFQIAGVVAVLLRVVTERVLQAGGREKILLSQPELLAALGGRVRIQHHCDVFGGVLGCHCIGITAGIEFIQIESIRRGCRPETQRIDDAVAVAGNRNVERNCEHIMCVYPRVARASRCVLVRCRAATEFDGLCELESFDFPWKAFTQPVIRLFHLVAVVDALPEHAVLVANSVTDHGQCESRLLNSSRSKASVEDADQRRSVLTMPLR